MTSINSFAIKAHALDNVATVFSQGCEPGCIVSVQCADGSLESVEAIEGIPYGHKIALRATAAGERVLKFGEEIGLASRDIAKGAHVHVHNLDSNRARGDRE